MEDPTSNEPEVGPDKSNEAHADRSHSLGAAIAAVLSSGSHAVHEGGVHGSVLAQTRSLVEEYIKPEPITMDGLDEGSEVPAYIDKDGIHVINPADLEPWATAPRFRRGTATMLDLPSFIGHVNRYADDHTVIFANNSRQSPSLTAVLDYHEAGADGAPRFGKHRTAFKFPLSDEWKAWVAKDGQAMEMAAFAEFLEDRVVDVMPPEHVVFSDSDDEAKRFVTLLGGVSKIGSPTKLMAISTGLAVHETSTLQQAQKLSSGEVKLTFDSEHTTTGESGETIIVPTMFALAIPVFVNDAPYRVLARLRYRKQGQKLVFWYDLWRTDKVFDHAFDEAVAKTQVETGKTVWLGTDEGHAA